jgi:hypothetical protein
LRKKTNAAAISGYQKNIDFISSTVFDVLYFFKMSNYLIINALNDKMFNLYSIPTVKFKIYNLPKVV